MGGLIFYVNISGLRKGANNHEEIWLSQNKYKRTAFRQRHQGDYDDIKAHQDELWQVMKSILQRLSTI